MANLKEDLVFINTIAVVTNSRRLFDELMAKVTDKVPEVSHRMTPGVMESNGVRMIHVNRVEQVLGLHNWEVMILEDAVNVKDFEKIMERLAADRARRGGEAVGVQ